MKQHWHTLALKIDALSLRERIMVFVAIAGVLLFLTFFLFLDPLYARQNILQTQIREQRNQIAGIDAEISQKIAAYGVDPDLEGQNRLRLIKAESAVLEGELRALQKNLVRPEKMLGLLQTILKSNGKLRLLSMKTLPSTGLVDGSFGDAGGDSAGAELHSEPNPEPNPASTGGKPVAPASKAAPLLFRHGVEITLQGSYLDMLNYMQALEAAPTQLFWGRANLDAANYPAATLTLTLYTLSLEQKWIAL